LSVIQKKFGKLKTDKIIICDLFQLSTLID